MWLARGTLDQKIRGWFEPGAPNPFSQNFRFELPEIVRVKWKGVSLADEVPRFQF